jgi:cytosine/adenosine deaminase-related metal-dependent hydrolase
MFTIIEGCAIATVDAAGTEHRDGHLVIEGDRIVAVGEGPAPEPAGDAIRIDGRGCLATPGLVNCHHHLYQWATRGLAQQATLFEWLVELYPVWARIDEEVEWAAARAGLAALARSGCSSSMDHHYVFPAHAGDLLEVEVEAAASIGVRFHPCRGSMDLGRSDGGLPPDEVVEDRDEILAASEAAIDRFHDPEPGAMVRVALAPCSPFSVTRELMAETAELARRRGVRLHTHLAETLDEEEFCRERFGVRPVEYLAQLGWLGEDVWLAHCVHLSDDEVRRFGETGTGVAHCPSSNARLGAGIAPVAALTRAGAPVGLGVDGAASNEAGALAIELRQALLFARLAGGPAALTAREALALGTIHGARCLGRDGELGSLEPGKLADVALWRLDGVDHAGIEDPVAALVLGPPRPVDTLLVGGGAIVSDGELRTAGEEQLAQDLKRASRKLAGRVGYDRPEAGRPHQIAGLERSGGERAARDRTPRR